MLSPSNDIEKGNDPRRDNRPTEDTPLLSPSASNRSLVRTWYDRFTKGSNDLSPQQQIALYKEYVVMGWAGLTFGTSLYSLLVYSWVMYPTICLASVVGVILSPYALVQQNKLTQIVALKEINAQLGLQINTLQAENDRLSSSVDDLKDNVKELSEMQQTLEELHGIQGHSMSELESQLEQSRDILSRLDSNVQSDVLQNIITVMLAGDVDNDLLLSDEEINKLIYNMESIHGVDLKDDLLRQIIIDNGRSIHALVEVARHALTHDVPPEQNIFSLLHGTSEDNYQAT